MGVSPKTLASPSADSGKPVWFMDPVAELSNNRVDAYGSPARAPVEELFEQTGTDY